jgi:RNA polymerase sigma factor (sigma-70 family)
MEVQVDYSQDFDWQNYWQDRSVQNRDRLVERYYDGLVKAACKIAIRQYRVNYEWEEIAGHVGAKLIGCIERFHLDVPYKFEVYAWVRTLGAAKDEIKALERTSFLGQGRKYRKYHGEQAGSVYCMSSYDHAAHMDNEDDGNSILLGSKALITHDTTRQVILRESIREVMRQLKPQERELCEHCWLKDLPQVEYANKHGLAESTISKQLTRLAHKMRFLLRDSGFDEF